MNFAILLAAGKGKRMGGKTPKALIEINGFPIFYYSLMAFYRNKNIDKIILVVDHEYFVDYEKLIDELEFDDNDVLLTAGGDTRSESLYYGYQTIKKMFKTQPEDIMVSHDVARIFVSDEMINNCISVANNYGLSTVALNATDTIIDLSTRQLLNRNNIYQIQTPQACQLGVFKDNVDNHQYDLDLIGYLKYNISQNNVVNGDMLNFKITFPHDIDLASLILTKGE